MKNPVFSRNPALSLWLSGANAVAGWWMGTATAAARRQQHTLMTDLARTMTGAKPRPKRRRKAAGPSRTTRRT